MRICDVNLFIIISICWFSHAYIFKGKQTESLKIGNLYMNVILDLMGRRWGKCANIYKFGERHRPKVTAYMPSFIFLKNEVILLAYVELEKSFD